jgi:hypothetical protein
MSKLKRVYTMNNCSFLDETDSYGKKDYVIKRSGLSSEDWVSFDYQWINRDRLYLVGSYCKEGNTIIFPERVLQLKDMNYLHEMIDLFFMMGLAKLHGYDFSQYEDSIEKADILTKQKFREAVLRSRPITEMQNIDMSVVMTSARRLKLETDISRQDALSNAIAAYLQGIYGQAFFSKSYAASLVVQSVDDRVIDIELKIV